MTRIERIDHMQTFSVQILGELLALQEEPRPAYYNRALECWQYLHRSIWDMSAAERAKINLNITT